MRKWLYWASIVLTSIGLVDSIYLTILKLTNDKNMCLGGGGCLVVANSPYAMIYGIPVAVYGVGGYLAILLMLILEKKGGGFFKKNGTMLLFGLMLAGFLFTLYLVYLEFFVIFHICEFCVISQIVMTILFVISVIRLIQQPSD